MIESHARKSLHTMERHTKHQEIEIPEHLLDSTLQSGENGPVVHKAIDDFPEDSLPYRWMNGESFEEAQNVPPLGDIRVMRRRERDWDFHE